MLPVSSESILGLNQSSSLLDGEGDFWYRGDIKKERERDVNERSRTGPKRAGRMLKRMSGNCDR